jgi:hypothetical protein
MEPGSLKLHASFMYGLESENIIVVKPLGNEYLVTNRDHLFGDDKICSFFTMCLVVEGTPTIIYQ